MSNDTMMRELDRGERFIWLVDLISNLNCVAIAELAGHPLNEADLRRGLDALQAAHPLLSARVVEDADGSVAYHRRVTAAIPLIVQDRDEDDWLVPVQAEMGVRFPDPEVPLARCHLLTLPERSVVAFTVHHAIADGRSLVMLANELMRFCLRGVPISHEEDVAPGMHALFPSAFNWGEQPEKARDLAQQIAEEALIKGPATALPFLTNEESEPLPRIKRISFDAERSVRLWQRCRDEGTSIQGALCAAELIAAHELLGEDEAKTMYLVCPADMRPRLEGDLGGRLNFCSTLLRSTHRVEGRSGFWKLSREVTADLRRRVQRGEGHLLYSSLPLDQIRGSGPSFEGFVAALSQLPAGLTATNQGVFDPLEDCPEVEAMSLTMLAMAKHMSSLNACSYRGKLIINMCYDDANLPPELATYVADTVEELLAEAAA